MAPFGIGLIGAGRMGRTHLRALARSDRVRVTAVAEMSPAAREAVAAPGCRPPAPISRSVTSGACSRSHGRTRSSGQSRKASSTTPIRRLQSAVMGGQPPSVAIADTHPDRYDLSRVCEYVKTK